MADDDKPAKKPSMLRGMYGVIKVVAALLIVYASILIQYLSDKSSIINVGYDLAGDNAQMLLIVYSAIGAFGIWWYWPRGKDWPPDRLQAPEKKVEWTPPPSKHHFMDE